MAGRYEFVKQPIEKYLGSLGSSDVSPGGGSAAALCGAMGAALVEMTSRINARREFKKSGRISAQARKNIARAEALKKKFGMLMRLDTEAFLRLAAIPKDKRSSAVYARALRHAAMVPIEISRLAVRVLEIGVSEVPRTSAWLASDLAEAGILLETAFFAGRLNAEINFKYIKDKKFVSAAVQELKVYEKKARRLGKALGGALR